MHHLKRLFSIVTVMTILAVGASAWAEEKQQKMVGAYLVVEGKVSRIAARMLTIDGQQYPVSMYAQVFMGDEKGAKMPLSTVVNVGKIDRARLYILGGMVQKIVVIQNI